MVTAHKKGISSHQLVRDLKITQKSAWFVLQRIKETCNPDHEEVFTDVVEVDETYVGGKKKNKLANKRTERTQGRSTKTKTPVLGILERNSKVYAITVKDSKGATILPIMRDKVADGTKVYTDEYCSYTALGTQFQHSFVKHSASEYVSAIVHTHSIENFGLYLKKVFVVFIIM